MPLSVVVLLKRTSYNKETKRKAENERSQSRGKMAITADSAPDMDPQRNIFSSAALKFLLDHSILI